MDLEESADVVMETDSEAKSVVVKEVKSKETGIRNRLRPRPIHRICAEGGGGVVKRKASVPGSPTVRNFPERKRRKSDMQETRSSRLDKEVGQGVELGGRGGGKDRRGRRRKRRLTGT